MLNFICVKAFKKNNVCFLFKFSRTGYNQKCKLSSLSSPRGNSQFEIKGTLLTHGPILNAYAEVDHTFSAAHIAQFMSICGDNNPIHHDTTFCETTIFKKPIVHGILLSSLFSTLFGRTISSSIYISQTLSFKKPVYVGSKVKAQMTVKQIDKKGKGYFLKCSTLCYTDLENSDPTVAIEGEASVLIPTNVYELYINKPNTINDLK